MFRKASGARAGCSCIASSDLERGVYRRVGIVGIHMKVPDNRFEELEAHDSRCKEFVVGGSRGLQAPLDDREYREIEGEGIYSIPVI